MGNYVDRVYYKTSIQQKRITPMPRKDNVTNRGNITRASHGANGVSSSRHNSRNERAASAISLSKFAHHKSKGTYRAIRNFRDKKKNGFNRRAGLLREYKKVMKNEGYEAGHGGNRKRPAAEVGEGIAGGVGVGDVKSSTSLSPKGRRRPASFDPLEKVRRKVIEHQEERTKVVEEIEERERKLGTEMKRRDARSKKMSKRTSRGQPIMKDVIGGMLQKLQNEQKNIVLSNDFG